MTGGAPFRRSDRHGSLEYPPLMEATLTPPAISDARVVEGSDGMLLEIDGQIVPNYDATIVPFEEGDVVTGKVVRIDKDEVLVDIGYKSEGVIPNNELSIRKSVDPHEEGGLGGVTGRAGGPCPRAAPASSAPGARSRRRPTRASRSTARSSRSSRAA